MILNGNLNYIKISSFENGVKKKGWVNIEYVFFYFKFMKIIYCLNKRK